MRWLPLGLAVLLWWVPAQALAQGGRDLVLTEEELTAWQLTQLERYVGARESVEEVLRRNQSSVVGHTVLAMIHRYAEGNLPRALYHLRRARRLLESAQGAPPWPDRPRAAEWHRRILQETAFTAGEMERFREELGLWHLHDRYYNPRMPGERIWPLLMLRRFNDARRWAKRALDSGDRWARRQALNGLCAVENEAGNRSQSYRWCVQHAQEIWDQPGYGGVYLCNAGEAARGLFRLDEAERYYLEATRREVEWYGNPWMFLAELYLRAGRLAPAAQAVRSMHGYARRRPPHTQQQDQSERNRTVAALLLVAGRPAQALPLTERALIYRDRRGGQSRSHEADIVTNALLFRRALLDQAEILREKAASAGPWTRLSARAQAWWLQVRAFRAGRRAVAHLSEPGLLQGLLEAEGRLSFGLPPWLVPDLIDVVGAGPVQAALSRARAEVPDDVPPLHAYLTAYGAAAAAVSKDWAGAVEQGRQAERGLPPGETLLRARTLLMVAQAYWAQQRKDEAASLFLELLQLDATLFRRVGYALPLRFVTESDALSRRVAELLRRSPRLRRDRTSPLVMRIARVGSDGCQLCLVTGGGDEAACAEQTLPSGGTTEDHARLCADAFHEQLLAPRVDMSLFDPGSLDGQTNRATVDDVLPGTTPPTP